MKNLCILMTMLFLFLEACRPSSSLPGHRQVPAEPPNIVLITVECIRWDHLPWSGYERNTMPRLQSFFSDACLFSNAVATSSWTLPSMVSLFSSKYPFEHGVYEGSFNRAEDRIEIQHCIPARLMWLPEALQKAGYTTFGWATNPHLIREIGFDRGFHYFDQSVMFAEAEVLAAKIRSVRERVPGDSPFFLWMHVFDPHWPYNARSSWKARFCPDIPNLPVNLFFQYLEPDIRVQYPDPDHEIIRFLRNAYDCEIGYLDEHIGRLMEELDLPGNTIYVLTGDHGEEFLDHGHLDHGYSLQRELVHVPLLLRWPDSNWQHGCVNTPVSLIDIGPTLLHYAGVEGLTEFRGQSLHRQLEGVGTPAERRLVYGHLDNKGIHQTFIADKRWKLIRDENDGRLFLFDHLSDGEEDRNCYGSRTEIVRRMTDQLNAEIGRYPRYLAERLDGLKINLNEEEKEQLTTMGYVQ